LVFKSFYFYFHLKNILPFFSHNKLAIRWVVGYGGGIWWWDIVVGYCGGILWWDRVVGYCGGILWWDIVVGLRI
jgi:hypothetical protein